jgi:hypothetical protein
MSEFRQAHHWLLPMVYAWFAAFWRQRSGVRQFPLIARFPVSVSRFSHRRLSIPVLSSQFSVLGSQFSVLITRIFIIISLAIALSGTPASSAAEPAHAHPFVRPAFAAQMETLRPIILDAAARHNDPAVSGMDDATFAEIMALVLYNEHFGWLEEAVPPLRPLTPWYQAAQMTLNAFGANLTVWPSNIRPSVALEMLRDELPVKGSHEPLIITLHVAGSRIDPARYRAQTELYAAINRELIQPTLAVEYLAANLERGVYRARHEGVPVTWQALAAWHNQGIVAPEDIAANPTARDYVRRAAVYRDLARMFIAADPSARHSRALPNRSPSAFHQPQQSSSYPDRCAPATGC